MNTTAVIFSFIGLIIAFDIFAYFRWGNPGTISVVLYEIAKMFPVIPFALGFVFGHIFWQVHIC